MSRNPVETHGTSHGNLHGNLHGKPRQAPTAYHGKPRYNGKTHANADGYTRGNTRGNTHGNAHGNILKISTETLDVILIPCECNHPF